MKIRHFVTLAATVAMPFAAHAAGKIETGVVNGISYTAKSLLVGQTSTSTVVGGGDPIYFANQQKYNGVVALIMEYDDGSFICTGSLIGASTIITAGHCVSEGAGTANPNKTTAYFYDWGNGDPDHHWSQAGSVAIDVSQYFVNPNYTGEVIDQADVAILKLAADAPDFATIYDLYLNGDLTGTDFNVAGNGNRSNAGGAVGANLGNGRLRQGDNTYSFALGDDAFGGVFTGDDWWGAKAEYSFVSDFDNGLFANDASCLISLDFGSTLGCDGWRGATEVGVAGGDSGGPQFVDGKVASVTSYGLSFGSDWGDVDDVLNSTWGEFSGYVPLYIHKDWIDSILGAGAVPEPATWAMMVSGFGFAGLAMRRRRKLASA